MALTVSIVQYQLWVSSRHDIQNEGNRGLDYAVKSAGNVGRKMQAIVLALINRSLG
jgi:hypothetical protein